MTQWRKQLEWNEDRQELGHSGDRRVPLKLESVLVLTPVQRWGYLCNGCSCSARLVIRLKYQHCKSLILNRLFASIQLMSIVYIECVPVTEVLVQYTLWNRNYIGGTMEDICTTTLSVLVCGIWGNASGIVGVWCGSVGWEGGCGSGGGSRVWE